MVVIRPFSMPQMSLSTLATGARQLVVQEAFETTEWFFGSYLSSFTPSTIVRSSPSAGALIITFFAPPFVMWFTAPLTSLPFLLTPSFFIVNRPVDSTTIWTPNWLHGRSVGSFLDKTFISLSFTIIEFSPALTLPPGKRPCTESYFNKWANEIG